jgi:anti-sigma regulatory factor (Ser/Thr protein kinase)
LWRGLVEISVVIDPRVSACVGPTAYAIERVIEEGVTNAVRHGSATEIVIDIQPDGSNIAVVVTDNGTGPGDGAPGLGSTHLDEITDSQWSLKAALGGVGSSLTALVTRTPRG